jgi:hypothetical protein
MSYSNLTLDDIRTTFGLTLEQNVNLFADLPESMVSDRLRSLLDEYIPLASAVSTEKVRSELLIAPILVEIRRLTQQHISLFSGIEFHVDPARGLSGVCDFILSRSPGQFFLTAPIVMVVEAKNENIKSGLIQCIGEMVAAQIFNQREGNEQEQIYGCVTTGTVWKFLKLEANRVFIDQPEYYIDRVGKIIAIFLDIVR